MEDTVSLLTGTRHRALLLSTLVRRLRVGVMMEASGMRGAIPLKALLAGWELPPDTSTSFIVLMLLDIEHALHGCSDDAASEVTYLAASKFIARATNPN
jgi:hypothetical protein